MPRLCATIVFLLALSVTPAPAQTQNLFLQAPTFPGTGNIITVDLNNDGKPDLINDDGTVLLGNGDGTFKTVVSWSVGSQLAVRSIVTSDVNGDGKPDLLVSFGAGSTILYVLLGNGDGTFQPAIGTNLGVALNSFVVVDVNGDGKADIAGLSYSGLFLFLGRGDGTFTAGNVYLSVTGNPLVAGDFNGDGKVDLVVGGGSAQGYVQALLGNGDGTFQIGSSIALGAMIPGVIRVGDVNGDHKLDLVVSDSVVNGTGQTFAMLGNGDGTFQNPSASLQSSGTVALADFNHDGKLDLVIGENPFAEIFLGNGDGTFALKHAYPAFGNQPPLVTADFNGDGNIDVAIANQILNGNGDGSFEANPASPGAYGLLQAVTADFNNDGEPDVAAIGANPNSNGGSGLFILLNDGSGAFSVAHAYAWTSVTYLNSLAAADLNGDGKVDLVTLTQDGSTSMSSLNVMLGDGTGAFSAPFAVFSGYPWAGPTTITLADFNGDHKPDIAFMGISGELAIFIGNGDGTFASPVSYFAGSGVSSYVVGDFNNDGFIDVAVASSAGLGILLGKGDGTFQAAKFSSNLSQVFAAGDLNGDGNLDFVASGTTGNQVLLGNGDGTFTPLPPQNLGLGVTSPVTLADVNKDGKLDLVTGPGVSVLLGNGDGTFGNAQTILPKASSGAEYTVAQFILTADFHRLGRADIVLDAFNVVLAGTGTSGGVITLLNTAPAPQADFLIAAKALPAAAIAPGASTTSIVTMTPIGAFTGAVGLTCAGLPSGANCSFSPSSMSGAGATSALMISTTNSTPPGTYPVGVIGTSGSLTHNANLNLSLATSQGTTRVGLAPTTLTFPLQALSVVSSVQNVQVSNIGAAALSFSNISVTGVNAGDFAILTNSCGSGIGVGTSCQVGVTFSPAGMGFRTAAISFVDNATGTPQMVALTGSAPDFSMSAGSGGAVAVKAGQPANYVLTLTPSASFSQNVAFTCTGNPTLTTCTVSPNPVSLNGSTAATANVSITTTAAKPAFVVPFAKFPPPRVNYRLWGFVAIFTVFLLVLTAMFTWRGQRRLISVPFAAIVALFFAVLSLAACGGGSSSSGGGGGGSPGTHWERTLSRLPLRPGLGLQPALTQLR